MKKIIEEYIRKTIGEALVDDLNAAVKGKFNIFAMINRKTVLHPEGEVIFRKNMIKEMAKDKLSSNTTYIVPKREVRTGCPTSRVVYMNGIITPYALALHQSNILARMLGEPVELVHNETEGIRKDLLECSEGREGIINQVTQDAIDAIKDKLTYEGDLTIVAHSQGAIVMTTALQALYEELSATELRRIKFVTFGAGIGDCVLPDYIFTEHFANALDPVTHLGLQSDDFALTGTLYVKKDTTGHFFIADYLIPIVNGETFGNSEFEKRLINK